MKTCISNLCLALALLAGIAPAAAQVGFNLTSTPGVGGFPEAVIAADVNGDGKLDLISANAGGNSISILTNNGAGGFAPNGAPLPSSNPNSVAAADVNGDGKVDIICTDSGSPGKITVFTNNGTGGFGSDFTYDVGANPYCVIAADVNNDGWVDLITANVGAGTLTVLTNNHAGRFFPCSTPVVGTGTGPLSVVAADVNGDGKMDLICANTVTYSLTVFTNDGTGNFAIKSVITTGVNHPSCVTAADVNGDGKVDLICANWGGGSLLVLTNDGHGNFAPGSTNGVDGQPACVIAADLNNDGNVDLISVNNPGSSLSVLTNNGTGIFSPAWSTNNLSISISVTAADVNSDGKLDLICANAGADNLAVFFNVSLLPLTNHLTNIVVSPASPTLAVSSNQQFTATGYYSDGSNQTLTSNLTWSSSSPAVASLTTNGLATGLTAGSATITAISGGVTNGTTLTVVPVLTNLVVNPANPTLAASSNQQFTATGYFNDGSASTLNGTVTWSSSSPAVATISISGGLATGVTNGATTITATSGSVNGNTILTVVAPPAIASQSTNGTVTGNGSVTLNVGATGGGLSYQWQFNGTNLSGATGASLTLTNYSAANVGVYTVVISNAAGSVTSLPIVIATTDIKLFAGVIINGPIGSNYLIQANGNLASTNWTTLTNLALPTQPYVYIDYNSPGNNQQFYRAVPNWTNTPTGNAPSGLSYAVNAPVYTKGVSIADDTPSLSGGGPVTSWSISAGFAATGLTFNTATGVISGTPTALSSATAYTVTASNSGGQTTTTVTITVNDVAPYGLSYAVSVPVYTKGTPIANNTPSVSGGPVTSWSISGNFAATGLTFNTATGVISGTPTRLDGGTVYVVTASNSGGQTATVLTIAVIN